MNWAFIKWHKWSVENWDEARNYLQSLLMHIKLLAWYLFVFLLTNSTNLVWDVKKVSFYLLIPRIVVLFLFVLFVLIRGSRPQADDASKLTSCASFFSGLTITVEIERSLMSCDFAHLVQWTFRLLRLAHELGGVVGATFGREMWSPCTAASLKRRLKVLFDQQRQLFTFRTLQTQTGRFCESILPLEQLCKGFSSHMISGTDSCVDNLYP